MLELKVNIWDSQFDDYWRGIPINMIVKSDGRLVMGGGKNSVAQQAKLRYPKLPKAFAELIQIQQRRKQTIFPVLRWLDDTNVNLMGFPTKKHWREASDLRLIEEGLIFLKGMMPLLVSNGQKEKVVCPRLGCGLGQLDWETQVKPLIEKYFGDDDNFIMVSL